MTNPAIRIFALSFLALGVAAVAFSGAASADPRIGVASATSGGPRGKPPAEAERVLHVGVDVQANEVISTGAADRAHLLFLDGSSLTVGPQARLVIDRFVYDPGSRSGTLSVNASQGVFRFVGGRISKSQPVTVITPSATLTVRGGIMLFKVEPGRTTAIFMFGMDMTVTANGATRVVTRPGWQVVTAAGGVPGQAAPVPPGGLASEMSQLEAQRAQPGSGDADRAAKSSGFSDRNSGLGPLGGASGPDPAAMGEASRAISDAGTQLQKPVPFPQTATAPGPRGGN